MRHPVGRPIRIVAADDIASVRIAPVQHPVGEPLVAVVKDADLDRTAIAVIDRRETVHRHQYAGPARLPPSADEVCNRVAKGEIDGFGPRLPFCEGNIQIARNSEYLADGRHGRVRFRRTVTIVDQA